MLPRLLPPLAVILPMLLLAACTPKSQLPGVEEGAAAPGNQAYFAESGHVPPFARSPYDPFRRSNAVGIAMREWQAFGRLVDDDPPHTRAPLTGIDNPARQPGLWERIGEYWWIGQNSSRREAAWTGMHDETGAEYDEGREDYYAWSAAFISYVMRSAGATWRFPYAPSHYIYINTAVDMTLGRTTGWAIYGEAPQNYAPQPGDLICLSRLARPLTYAQLPSRHFPGHCDIVVAQAPGQISVVGGNVDDAVTMKHIPLTQDGKLATPDGEIVDGRYPWMVVIRVMYDQ
jgi:Uncharacterized protein conserved in bacteria (DUF2272)